MPPRTLLLLPLLTLLLLFPFLISSTLLEADQTVLLNFYNSLTSKGSLEWNSSASLCGQTGIFCDGSENSTSPQRATGILITSMGISGTISTELAKLSQLQILAFSTNDLSGTLPSELGTLQFLIAISLPDNKLTGTIPTQFGKIPLLESLELGNNRMSGTLPVQLGDAKNLVSVLIQNNSFTGSIPTQLNSLPHLETLDLSKNQFSGTLPLLDKTSLTELTLTENFIQGTFSLSNFPASLSTLKLRSNKFFCPVTDYSSISTNDFTGYNNDCNYSCGFSSDQNPCKGQCAARPEYDYECFCDGASCSSSSTLQASVALVFLLSSLSILQRI